MFIISFLFACLSLPEETNPLANDNDGDGYSEFDGDQNDSDPSIVGSCPDVQVTCPEPVINLSCPSVEVTCPPIPEPTVCPDVEVTCPEAPSSSNSTTSTSVTEVKEHHSETWSGNGSAGIFENTDSRTFILTGVFGAGSSCKVRFDGVDFEHAWHFNANGGLAKIGYEVPLMTGDQIELLSGGNNYDCMLTGYWVSYQ